MHESRNTKQDHQSSTRNLFPPSLISGRYQVPRGNSQSTGWAFAKRSFVCTGISCMISPQDRGSPILPSDGEDNTRP